jgi:hypothetical protein
LTRATSARRESRRFKNPRLTDQRRLHLTEPRSPWLRNPDQLRRGERYRPRPSQGGQFWTPIGVAFRRRLTASVALYAALSISSEMSQVGSNVAIGLGADSITLVGVSLSSLAPTDFKFA